MTPTLLLDLDNTLLGNDMADFIPAYLRSFSTHMASKVEPNRFVECLLSATQAAISDQRPDRTLRETFAHFFYTDLGVEHEIFQNQFDTFYEQEFPALKKITRYRPAAVAMVDQALAQGHQIAITTNPLFPRTAILQRLEWAGLSYQKYPFTLVCDLESFHFAKPNPAFFAEALAKIGWPDGSILVVGDDYLNDITAARRLGLPAFWVSDEPPAEGDSRALPLAWGELSQVLPWMLETPEGMLTPKFRYRDAYIATLNGTVAALDTLLAPLSEDSWKVKPSPTEWSLTEIICHLRDVEHEVNTPRIEQVLASDNPLLIGENTDPWAEERSYHLQEGKQALQDFTVGRLSNLSKLEPLTAESWHRPARHTIFGPTNLEEIVDIIAGHDRIHLQQIHKLLSTLSLR